MSFRSFILLFCTLVFGIVLTTEGNTRRYPAPGKHVLALLEEEQDAQDYFEETDLVLTEINAQRPGRYRSRFTASPTYFIISSVSRAEDASVKDIHVSNSYVFQQQAHTLPFYYLFLFRLTPF
ncbi:hypothetical protein [Pseudobacter ginsenosidimutans]|uniref:hypothetical protein n=1 Tax=Pseudobacter ginsenosidimutans TaxID=661488 RepID=UPI00102DC81E|nr:hypothetical protein [Pseudobacter ginsenosidimutans]QEC43296.1 hypothetical protein FSB84_16920 [Pseudobacter ginsenosidimutans]